MDKRRCKISDVGAIARATQTSCSAALQRDRRDADCRVGGTVLPEDARRGQLPGPLGLQRRKAEGLRATSGSVQAWLDEQYPEIEQRAKAEGAEIHWGDETALVNTDVRGRSDVPAGKTPVACAVGSTRQKLSIIATVTNQGKTRWMIIDQAFNSDKLIEFLEALTKETGQEGIPDSGQPAGPASRSRPGLLSGKTRSNCSACPATAPN